MLRGWRLLPFVDLPQTPKQAAEVAMLLKERDRSNILVLRVFDDTVNSSSRRLRGCGDSPSFTVVVRMGRNMNMALIRYRVFRAWVEEGHSADKGLDWRTDVILRHPVTAQQFAAVDSTDLSHLELKLVAQQAPCARMHSHLHSQDVEELPNTHAGVTTLVGTGPLAASRPELLHDRFAYRYGPMADVFGPPVALLDWADSYGRIDVVLSVKTTASIKGAVEPPKFLELAAKPGYKYFNDTTLPGSVISTLSSPKALPEPHPLHVRSMHQAKQSPYLHFSGSLVPPAKLTLQFTREAQKPDTKGAHVHAWPLEQVYAARICSACDKVFCLAMYQDDKYKHISNLFCTYHTQKVVNGKFPCCGVESTTCVELLGGRISPDANYTLPPVYSGDSPCVSQKHQGHFMFPLRYFLPSKY